MRFKLGDSVCFLKLGQSLELHWNGLYLVLLTTPIAIKVDSIAAWIHASQEKPVTSPTPGDHPSWSMEKASNPLKLKITQ